MFKRSRPDAALYAAIVEAERAARHAHDLCYRGDGSGAGYWLAAGLGKAQSMLMTYVVRYAGQKR